MRRPARIGGRRRLVAAAALAAYGGSLAGLAVGVGGVPASRDVLVPIVLVGCLAASVSTAGRLRRLAVGLVVDWLPLMLALWLYDVVRGLADGNWLPVHHEGQIGVDRLAGLGAIPSVWLQRRLWHGAAHVTWWDYATWVVYMSFFFATTVVLVVLWWVRPALYRRFAAMVVGLAVAGCVTYVLYPAEPPWMAALEGYVPPLDRIVEAVNGHLPVVTLEPLWERGTSYANDVAAVPSLHAANTLLIALFVARRLRSRLRHLLWLYPLAMGFALVYTGEHYVADILLGWLYALVVWAVVEKAADRMAERRLRSRRRAPARLSRATSRPARRARRDRSSRRPATSPR